MGTSMVIVLLCDVAPPWSCSVNPDSDSGDVGNTSSGVSGGGSGVVSSIRLFVRWWMGRSIHCQP